MRLMSMLGAGAGSMPEMACASPPDVAPGAGNAPATGETLAIWVGCAAVPFGCGDSFGNFVVGGFLGAAGVGFAAVAGCRIAAAGQGIGHGNRRGTAAGRVAGALLDCLGGADHFAVGIILLFGLVDVV